MLSQGKYKKKFNKLLSKQFDGKIKGWAVYVIHTDLVESDPTFSAEKNVDNLDFTVPDPQGYGYRSADLYYWITDPDWDRILFLIGFFKTPMKTLVFYSYFYAYC